MRINKIMFAVASPEALAPSTAHKLRTLTQALGADLELFHCIHESSLVTVPTALATGYVRSIVEHRRRQLERSAAWFRRRGIRARSSVRWDRPPYRGIVRHVLRHRPDLLVVQSTAAGWLRRALGQRSDYHLIESCPCPVLVLQSKQSYSSGCVIATVDPCHAQAKSGPLDDRILEMATAVGHALSLDVRVYHACTPWEEVARQTSELRALPEAEVEDARSAYRQSVAQVPIALAARHDISAARVRIVEGDLVECLPAFVRSEPTQIVVSGAMSRSLIRRMVAGYTSERLLDRLGCDMLIVKPAGFRSRVTPHSIHTLPRVGVRARYVY